MTGQEVVALPYEPSTREMDEWNANVSDAIEVEGYSLFGGKENDRALDSLVGIPFLVKHVTFRHGDIVPPKGNVYDGKSARDYVSVEVLIHPEHAHKFPRRYVVFNDGSTGIYRQLVAALTSQGLITANESLPEEGGANETRYDLPLSKPSEDGWEPAEYKIHILAPEGLRKSEYAVPGAGQAITWYLA